MTDKIKQQALKKFNDNLNKLSDFDKNLILWIKQGKPTIHVIIKNVSRSGMLRRVQTFIIKDNKLYFINYLIEQLTHYKKDSDGLLKLHGCGMDMGFSLVYDFARSIFPTGFKSSRRNAINGMKPTDKGFNWDNDGGYALSNRNI